MRLGEENIKCLTYLNSVNLNRNNEVQGITVFIPVRLPALNFKAAL